MPWKGESKVDEKGRQQEERKVAENMMNWMEEKRKDDGEGVQ